MRRASTLSCAKPVCANSHALRSLIGNAFDGYPRSNLCLIYLGSPISNLPDTCPSIASVKLMGSLKPREVSKKTIVLSSSTTPPPPHLFPLPQSAILSSSPHGWNHSHRQAGRPTSAEVVRQVKHRVKPARVGHLGTLDPFATGVLPILVGEGTKLAPFLHEGEKHYEGLIALGTETDTLDRTGEVVRTAPVPEIGLEQLAAIAARFTGTVTQTPPIFSAIKRGGVPLYKLARRGDDVAPPPPRDVQIERLELAAEGPGAIRFSLVCSPGTYIRSLARDIGIALESAAHLSALRRTRTGLSRFKTPAHSPTCWPRSNRATPVA